MQIEAYFVLDNGDELRVERDDADRLFCDYGETITHQRIGGAISDFADIVSESTGNTVTKIVAL